MPFLRGVFLDHCIDELKRIDTIGTSSPFVEIKAHMHMLCVYSLKRWQETSFTFYATTVHMHAYHRMEGSCLSFTTQGRVS